MMAPYFSASGGKLVHRADVAVHRKHAVGDDQFAAWLVGHFLQKLFAMGHILVPEHLDLGPRQPRPVDDAGMVELVGEDEVFLAQDGAYRARIGREAALEDDAGFDVFEAGDLLFEVHVDAHGSGDGTHRARAHAQFPRSLQRRLDQPGVVGEAEIVVAGQVDHLPAVVVAHRGLLVVEHPQFEMRAFGAQFVERGGQVAELGTGKLRADIGLNHGGHLKKKG